MQAPRVQKERALSADEIKAVWHELEREEIIMTGDVRRAIKLILVTAQRPGEVSAIHTHELNGTWWIIPSERAKNGKAHRVPLSSLALETERSKATPAEI